MPWLPVLHTVEEDLSYVRRRLAGPAEGYVFEDGGGPLGFAMLVGDELSSLYVAPDEQGRGVGSALFAHVQTLRPDGFRLWAFRDNTRARRFYEARGCIAVRETDGDNEEGLPDVLYEWRAPSPGGAEA